MILILVLFFGALLIITLALLNSRTATRLVRRAGGSLLGVGLILLAGFLLAWYQIVRVHPCTPDCIGANLLRRDLRGFDLHGVKLIGADLQEANLSGVNLSGADLSGAMLTRANLENADLRGALLLGVDLTGATLTGAQLTNADLRGSVLNEAILTGVDLHEVTLAGVWFQGANLVDANLAGVTLTTTDLSEAKLNGANLDNANLSGSTLSLADLSGARLPGVNLSGGWLNRALLIGADVTKADLSGVGLIAANLASADLTDSNLVGAVLVGVDLKGATLNATNLNGVRLRQSELIELDFADPAIAALNELQRSQLLVDARLDGSSFDQQTVWPDEKIAAQLQPPTPNIAPKGATIKVGVLHSLSGPLALSELAVRDATLLALSQINNAGGILGKQLQPFVEDGASDPAVFAAKARKLLAQNRVAVIFGGWSSASRKAMLPVLTELNGLLFYPVAYEGLESSPQIFYTGADPSQQIIPAVNYLAEQGHKNFMLIGTDSAYPRTVNAIVKAQLATVSATLAAEVYIPLDAVDFTTVITQVENTKPDVVFNTLYGASNVAFFRQLRAAGLTASNLPVMSVNIAEEEARTIGAEYLAGHLTAWNYYQTVNTVENQLFVADYKAAYGEERVTSDPIEAAYLGVYLWKAMVEQAQSTAVDAVRTAAEQGDIRYQSPGGLVRIDGKTFHTYKTVRIGVVRADGLIDAIFTSTEPVPPDPFLTQYPWASELVAALQKRESEEKPK